MSSLSGMHCRTSFVSRDFVGHSPRYRPHSLARFKIKIRRRVALSVRVNILGALHSACVVAPGFKGSSSVSVAQQSETSPPESEMLVRSTLAVLIASLCLLAPKAAARRTAAVAPFPARPMLAALPTGGLLINEYLADPPAVGGDANGDGTISSSQDEFVELVNSGASALNVGGYKLVVGATVRFIFPAAKSIPPGEAAVIFGGGTPTGAFGNAKALGLVFTASLSLVNGGTTIAIRDNLDVTLDSLTYGNAEGNADQSITRSPDITGSFVKHSLAPGSAGAIFSPGTKLDGSLFGPAVPTIDSISPDGAVSGQGPVDLTVIGSAFDGGANVLIDGSPIVTTFESSNRLSAVVPIGIVNSPGAHAINVQNSTLAVSNAATFTVLAAIGINELLADPPGSASTDLQGDANGDGIRDSSDDEFIEIINRSAAPIGVGGYSITDAGSTSPRFIFPPGTIIPAGEVAVIFGGGSPHGDFGNAALNGLVFSRALSLNNTSETITLKDGANTVIETVTWGAEGGQDESLNRNPEVTGVHFVKHSTVPGAGARKFSPGTTAGGSAFTVGPRITSISPAQIALGAAEFDLMVEGSGFEPDSGVIVDSISLPTSRVSDNVLTARVLTSITAIAGLHAVTVRNPGGNKSNPIQFLVIPPPPLVFNVVPRVIPRGTSDFTVIVVGRNFEAGSSVLVDGTPASTVFANPTELRATIPAAVMGALGQKQIKVRNSDGQESGVIGIEVVLPPLRINSLAPAEALTDSQGFTLTINGANFIAGTTAFFDGSALPTSFVSSTRLDAQVDARFLSAPGAHAISLQNPDGGLSNELVFRVNPISPLISSLDPPAVETRPEDLKIGINGSRFQRGAVVRFASAGREGLALPTSFISTERLEATVPGAILREPGTLILRIDNPDFGFSNLAALKILIKDALVINEYLADPPEGAAGDANGDGARSSSQDEFVEILNRSSGDFDISGFSIADKDAVRHVFPAGTVIPPFEAAVVFGGGTPGKSFGNAASNHLVFKASTGGLSLNNGGDEIKLEDSEGRLIQRIVFGPIEGGAAQSLNRDPDGDGGSFSLHMLVAGDPSRLFSPGEKVSGRAFTTKPAITALSPSNVRAGTAELRLSVTGSEFLGGAALLFNNIAVPAEVHSSSELEAVIPAELLIEPGAAEVKVRNPKGEVSAGAKFVLVGDPPRIDSITPDTTGTGAENLEVTIRGDNFQKHAVLTINGEGASSSALSPTSLTFVMPASFCAKAGIVTLKIINEDGNESNARALAVQNGPLITRLGRKKIRAGRGEVQLTVGGVQFKEGGVLFVNDVAVATRFVSDVELDATIPAEFTASPATLTLQVRNPDGGRSNKANLRVVH